MKKILKNLIASAILLCFMASCDGLMDFHKDYIKDGETIYAPKVDSMSFIAGKERILFQFWLYNSPNVKTVDIFWNSKTDSLNIPVSPSFGIDSLEVVLPNMKEQSYTFDVRTTDNFGHKSLWTTGFGNSYGEFFASSLMERRVRELSLGEDGGVINLFTGIEGLVRTEIRYQKKDGTYAIVSTSRLDNTVDCPGAKSGSTFEYRSLFIPEEASIDTFALAWQESSEIFPSIFLYNRANWSVLSVSDQTASDGGGMHTMLDGDLGSYWHSQWDGGNAPLPHWAIIDMVTAKDFIMIDTYRRPGNTDAKDIEYYVGSEPDAESSTWVKVGSGQYPNHNQDKLTIDIDGSVNTAVGRYLKLVITSSHRDPFTSIAEIYLYGGSK